MESHNDRLPISVTPTPSTRSIRQRSGKAFGEIIVNKNDSCIEIIIDEKRLYVDVETGKVNSFTKSQIGNQRNIQQKKHIYEDSHVIISYLNDFAMQPVEEEVALRKSSDTTPSSSELKSGKSVPEKSYKQKALSPTISEIEADESSPFANATTRQTDYERDVDGHTRHTARLYGTEGVNEMKPGPPTVGNKAVQNETGLKYNMGDEMSTANELYRSSLMNGTRKIEARGANAYGPFEGSSFIPSKGLETKSEKTGGIEHTLSSRSRLNLTEGTEKEKYKNISKDEGYTDVKNNKLKKTPTGTLSKEGSGYVNSSFVQETLKLEATSRAFSQGLKNEPTTKENSNVLELQKITDTNKLTTTSSPTGIDFSGKHTDIKRDISQHAAPRSIPRREASGEDKEVFPESVLTGQSNYNGTYNNVDHSSPQKGSNEEKKTGYRQANQKAVTPNATSAKVSLAEVSDEDFDSFSSHSKSGDEKIDRNEVKFPLLPVKEKNEGNLNAKKEIQSPNKSNSVNSNKPKTFSQKKDSEEETESEIEEILSIPQTSDSEF